MRISKELKITAKSCLKRIKDDFLCPICRRKLTPWINNHSMEGFCVSETYCIRHGHMKPLKSRVYSL